VTWTGRIGLLGALIGESDIYIGYDSAGQHIAAALGVRCVDVFAGAEARFRRRWSPTGRSECVVVDATRSDRESALSQVLTSVRRLLGT
jgi:ADP-heptose:LPS heptosyltransferase